MVNGLGSAGGHGMVAGGQILTKGLAPEKEKKLGKILERRFLKIAGQEKAMDLPFHPHQIRFERRFSFLRKVFSFESLFNFVNFSWARFVNEFDQFAILILKAKEMPAAGEKESPFISIDSTIGKESKILLNPG